MKEPAAYPIDHCAARSAAEGLAAASFYHLRDAVLQDRCCQGLACFAGRADAPQRWQAAQAAPRVYCLGRCYAGPASTRDSDAAAIQSGLAQPLLLERILAGGAATLADYTRRGGGAALKRARSLAPAAVIEQVEVSRLRGRGGAGFPTGRKWRAVAQQAAPLKIVVANADEGDPGAFSDRVLMEQDPFAMIEALCIAAHAVGATRGVIYLRKEYAQAQAVLTGALAEAHAAGWLSAAFDVELHIGQGSYVAGEETAMLNSIEGRRGEARARPPQVFERGLFGAPTLVNNVETLCAVPWILRHSAAAYAALGFSNSRGSKLLSLNSLFRRPGLYEVEFGVSLRHIVDALGGGLKRGTLKALMIGGPLAGLLPPSQLDVPLGFEELQAVGGAVGHGGVIAFNDDSSIRAIAEQVFRFGAYESCGKCTPCFRGTPLLARAFDGEPMSGTQFAERVDALAATSLCGHGRGLAEFARSLQRHFGAELSACLS